MWRAIAVWLLVCSITACGRVNFAQRTDVDAAPAIDAPAGPRFNRVTAYGDLTCADYAGRLYCWGENSSRQLGDGTTTNRAIPTEVMLPAGTLGAFTAGETHACAIVEDLLHCWGQATGTQTFATPTKIADVPITDVAAGKRFTCIVLDGAAKCWGANDIGQLGDTTTTSRDTAAPIADTQGAIAVDAGDDHACVLTQNSTAICWGHNDDGALGFGAFAPASQPTPITVTNGIATLPRIAGWHACTLRGAEVWCWGRNTEGELGDGTVVAQAAPQVVPGMTAATVVATGGGPADLDATCAIHDGGILSCWGAGTGGRLGTGNTNPAVIPMQVGNLPGPVADVALGYAHTCALLADGDLWCWGRGTAGQLGHGEFADSFTPVRVTPPAIP